MGEQIRHKARHEIEAELGRANDLIELNAIEIKELKSRKCENCKYSKHTQTMGIGLKKYSCELNISQYGNNMIPSRNDMDFGCNRWEKR